VPRGSRGAVVRSSWISSRSGATSSGDLSLIAGSRAVARA
jgi:hypothetical protein